MLISVFQILTPFLLRRVKADVDVKIPPKREILVTIPLAPLQDKFYRATVDKSIIQLLHSKEVVCMFLFIYLNTLFSNLLNFQNYILN